MDPLMMKPAPSIADRTGKNRLFGGHLRPYSLAPTLRLRRPFRRDRADGPPKHGRTCRATQGQDWQLDSYSDCRAVVLRFVGCYWRLPQRRTFLGLKPS